MRILLLCRYGRMGASSRLRTMQYLPFLQSRGWKIDVAPLFSDQYIDALYTGRARWVLTISGYWNRLVTLLSVKRYDLVWLEKELFPFLPAGIERLLNMIHSPYVVDYDDAVFHRYDLHPNLLIRWLLGKKIDSVMRHAALAVVGNEYLAERARAAGAPRVEIIPTVVDLQRYSVSPGNTSHTPVIGWIGSPVTSRYLLDLKPVFAALKKQFAVRFVAVGVRQEDFTGSAIEVWPWTEETEVQSIQKFDVGIMPLSNTPWERGKCGYKIIQYMACGLPVVASPVGVNKKIIKHGENGFLAESHDEWQERLGALLKDINKRKRMGQKGRLQIEEAYSLQSRESSLFSELQSVAGNMRHCNGTEI